MMRSPEAARPRASALMRRPRAARTTAAASAAAAALFVAVLASSAEVARAAGALQCVQAGEEADVQRASAKWWARLHDKVYLAPSAPPASALELSQDISDYYYGVGSDAALTREHWDARVGGEGRFHIFHLPRGPSMLQVSSNGDRRSSLSALVQLQHGAVLGKFPVFEVESYVYPGGDGARELENKAVELVTPEVFHSHLEQITGLGTRSWVNSEATKKTQDFLQDQFTQMGLPSCLQTFSHAGKTLANVVAYIPGSSPEEAGTVTLGAHYDSRPYEGAAPGAEDNGSGLASLLTAAKAFKNAGLRPKKTIYFTAFAAEEPGLVGSKEFVQALQSKSAFPEALRRAGPKEGSAHLDSCDLQTSFLSRRGSAVSSGEGAPPHVGIILDEVGWKSPKDSAYVNLESFDWTMELMAHLKQASEDHNGKALQVVHSNNPFGSDHMSFLDQKWPAVLVINGDDEAYPHYHKSSDTIDNVDTEYATSITRLVLGGLVRTAGLHVEPE